MKQYIFRDKDGKVALIAWPNWALIGWGSFSLLGRFTQWKQLAWIGTAFLLVWALLEIFLGVNYFRRALGLAVLVLTLGKLLA